MSPTIFKFRKFRFFFFSREEPRMHVHVYSPEGEAKYWLEPRIELAVNYGIRQPKLKTIQKQIEGRSMSLKRPGKNTSKAEVTHVSSHGLWVLVKEKEYLLPYSDYPWFSEAKVSDLMAVELIHGRHLRWPSLDVDIEVESLDYPDRYPLVYQNSNQRTVACSS